METKWVRLICLFVTFVFAIVWWIGLERIGNRPSISSQDRSFLKWLSFGGVCVHHIGFFLILTSKENLAALYALLLGFGCYFSTKRIVKSMSSMTPKDCFTCQCLGMAGTIVYGLCAILLFRINS